MSRGHSAGRIVSSRVNTVTPIDRFGMDAVIAIRRVGHLAAGVADPCGYDTVVAANEVLHAPEAALVNLSTLFGASFFPVYSLTR
jgi:hypothetical protein